MLAGEIDEGDIEKARMSHLDHMTHVFAFDATRQELEKSGDVVRLESLAGMELPEYRPELSTQFQHAAGEEAVDRSARLGEHAALGGGARRLERKHKIIRRFARPFAKALPRLRAIEGAIDLDRGQPAAGRFD